MIPQPLGTSKEKKKHVDKMQRKRKFREADWACWAISKHLNPANSFHDIRFRFNFHDALDETDLPQSLKDVHHCASTCVI